MKAKKLNKIKILILDADVHVADIVIQGIRDLGIGICYHYKTTAEALEVLQSSPVDLVITEWGLQPIDGIEFVRRVRTEQNSPNRSVPIIMLTGRGEVKDIQTARDAGITEFLVKPFTIHTLYSRIEHVVDRPRNFVVSQHFVGPDRRRKHLPPDDKTEKRGRRVPLIKKPPQVPAKSESPLLLMPEYELRRALGLTGPLSEVITPSVIAAAQAEIDLRQDDAMQWIRQDLEAIQDSFANLRKSPSPQAAEQMQMTTLSLKSRAGIFGYQVASDIAHLLYRFVFKEYDAKRPADNQIVQQSIEALKVIIGQNIKLPNHMTDELVEELRRALKTE